MSRGKKKKYRESSRKEVSFQVRKGRRKKRKRTTEMVSIGCERPVKTTRIMKLRSIFISESQYLDALPKFEKYVKLNHLMRQRTSQMFQLVISLQWMNKDNKENLFRDANEKGTGRDNIDRASKEHFPEWLLSVEFIIDIFKSVCPKGPEQKADKPLLRFLREKVYDKYLLPTLIGDEEMDLLKGFSNINWSRRGACQSHIENAAQNFRAEQLTMVKTRYLENINQFINIAMDKKDKLFQIKNNDLLSKQQKKADKTKFMSELQTIKKEMISPTYNPSLVHPIVTEYRDKIVPQLDKWVKPKGKYDYNLAWTAKKFPEKMFTVSHNPVELY